MSEGCPQERKARLGGYGPQYEEIAYEEIVGALERTGSWGCNGWLHENDLIEVRKLARTRGFYVQFVDQTDRPEEWYDAARPGVDQQTGIGNWAALIRDLDKERAGRGVAIVFVDIDELTDIKRSSPLLADSIVSMVARELAALREGRSVYRYRNTGDEFVILLESDEDPDPAARRIDDALSPLRVRHFGAYVGATAIAVQGAPGETSEQLVDGASHKMIRRKVVRRSRGPETDSAS